MFYFLSSFIPSYSWNKHSFDFLLEANPNLICMVIVSLSIMENPLHSIHKQKGRDLIQACL